MPVKFSDVYIDYLDDDGKLLDIDDACWCIPEALKPGEIGYIYSAHNDIGYINSDNGCKPEAHFRVNTVKNLYTVEATDTEFKVYSGIDIEVTCKAVNNSNEDISMASPGAVFYGADGSVLGFGCCYDIVDIKAGRESTLNLWGI